MSLTRDPLSELRLEGGDVIVFIDETGDTVMGTSQAPVFGLGAVMVAAESYAPIRQHWASVKADLLGDPNRPLHAAEIPKEELTRYGAAIGAFFQVASFRRIGVTHSLAVQTDTTAGPYGPVMECFLGAIANQLTKHAAGAEVPRRVLLVFEHSQKLHPDIERLASNVGARVRLPTGVELELPLQVHALRKSSGEYGLEWADFVAQASFRRSRDRARGRPPGRDFNAIFSSGSNADDRGEWRDLDVVATGCCACWDLPGGHHWATSGEVRVDTMADGGWQTFRTTRQRCGTRGGRVRRIYE